MADTDYLLVSNGGGDAALMHITDARLQGSQTIKVDTVANWPAKFIATMGTLGSDGKITSATKCDFIGHLSSGNVIIDGFAPGSSDAGNTQGQIIVIKPNTRWSDLVAQFIQSFSLTALLPTATILPFAGSSVPSGFLLCDGSAVSRTSYPNLFAAIGSTYGGGNGNSTFNVPNLKGRTLVGQDGNQTEFNTLGKSGGEKSHLLTLDEMPSHNHGVNDPGHGHGINDGGHRHGMEREVLYTAGSTNTTTDNRAGGYKQITWADFLTGVSGANVSVQGAGTGVSVQPNGGGVSHNNLQPYLVANAIIKV